MRNANRFHEFLSLGTKQVGHDGFDGRSKLNSLSQVINRSILFRDLRRSANEAASAISYQEVTVGNRDGAGVHADNYVHPVVIFPELSDLHMAQVDWPAKGLDHLFSDSVIECLTLIPFRLVFELLAQ
jgi:hypothetical protein